jgi:hypothetical protein
MRKFYILISVFLSLYVNAQEALLAELNAMDRNPSKSYIFATFKGTRVINMQSIELPGEGIGQFIVGHRFGALNDKPLYNLFGMDMAQIRFEYSYSPKSWINLGAGRSSGAKTYDFFTKIRLLRQSKGSKCSECIDFPISIAYYGSATIFTTPYSDNIPHDFLDRVAYTNQIIIARKFNKNISMQLVPTLVHYNIVPTALDNNDLFALGIGARYKLTNRMALTSEIMLRQEQPSNTFNALSIGIDIETGGHVFQFHLTNSRYMADNEWITQNPGSWAKGDIFLGFNISRVFTH